MHLRQELLLISMVLSHPPSHLVRMLFIPFLQQFVSCVHLSKVILLHGKFLRLPRLLADIVLKVELLNLRNVIGSRLLMEYLQPRLLLQMCLLLPSFLHSLPLHQPLLPLNLHPKFTLS